MVGTLGHELSLTSGSAGEWSQPHGQLAIFTCLNPIVNPGQKCFGKFPWMAKLRMCWYMLLLRVVVLSAWLYCERQLKYQKPEILLDHAFCIFPNGDLSLYHCAVINSICEFCKSFQWTIEPESGLVDLFNYISENRKKYISAKISRTCILSSQELMYSQEHVLNNRSWGVHVGLGTLITN